MTLAIAISCFFGLVAALSLASCHASLRRAYVHYCAIRAELTALNHHGACQRPTAFVPLRRPQEAFARAALG